MHAPARLATASLLALLAAACGDVPAPSEPIPDELDGKAGVYEGRCDAAAPQVARSDWRHGVASPLIAASGAPNHRVRDLILAPGERGTLRARFTYSFVDKDLEDEIVELWLQRCPAWVRVGAFRTDDDGRVAVPLPLLPAGDYRVRFVVTGDGSTADGVVAVWRPGMQVLVSDVDGTLTTSDWELPKDVLGGADAAMYADADKVMRGWADKGYRIVYLTGRPSVLSRYTRTWLDTHGMPRAPLRVTDDVIDILPAEFGVAAFKSGVLAEAEARVGLVWTRAYGNASTDVTAYEDAGIAKAATFIIGPNAGERGTVALGSYTAHLPTVAQAPAAKQP